jgi:hypothetical protein
MFEESNSYDEEIRRHQAEQGDQYEDDLYDEDMAAAADFDPGDHGGHNDNKRQQYDDNNDEEMDQQMEQGNRARFWLSTSSSYIAAEPEQKQQRAASPVIPPSSPPSWQERGGYEGKAAASDDDNGDNMDRKHQQQQQGGGDQRAEAKGPIFGTLAQENVSFRFDHLFQQFEDGDENDRANARDEILVVFDKFCADWGLAEGDEFSVEDMVGPRWAKLVVDRFGETLSIEHLSMQWKVYQARANHMVSALTRVGAFPADERVRRNMQIVVQRIIIAHDFRKSCLLAVCTVRPRAGQRLQFNLFNDIVRESSRFPALSDFHQGLIVAGSALRSCLFYHRREVLFVPKKDREGNYLHCYVPFIADESIDGAKPVTIDQFLRDHAGSNTTSHSWIVLRKKDSLIGSLADTFQQENHADCPEYTPSLYHFCYSNGRFCTATDSFDRYQDISMDDQIKGCNYSDLPFELYDDLRGDFSTGAWFDIRKYCPTWMSILDYQIQEVSAAAQGGGEEKSELKRAFAAQSAAQSASKDVEIVKRFILAFMGRLGYPVNKLDSFAMGIVLQGPGQTGKSEFTKGVLDIYQSLDIGTYDNDLENKFGIGMNEGKRIWRMNEMSEKCNLKPSDYKVMVEGGVMAMAVKHGSTNQTNWTAPGIVLGNNFSKLWRDDKSGALERRIFSIFFRNIVGRRDEGLGKKIQKERAAIHAISNRAYLSLVKELKDRRITSIHEVLPEWFKENIGKLFERTNSFSDFLDNGPLIYGDHDKVYMPLAWLKYIYQRFCEENHAKPQDWNEELYAVPFSERKLRIDESKHKVVYPREEGQTWVCKNKNIVQKKGSDNRLLRITQACVLGVDFDYRNPRGGGGASSAAAPADDDDGGGGGGGDQAWRRMGL